MPTEDVAIQLDARVHIFNVVSHFLGISFEKPADASDEERISCEGARVRGKFPNFVAFKSGTSYF